MTTLFDHVDDDSRARLVKAGWHRDSDKRLAEGDSETWVDGDGNRFSLGGAIAELERSEGRKP